MESTKLSEQKIAKDREEDGISHCLSKVDSMDNNESGKFAQKIMYMFLHGRPRRHICHTVLLLVWVFT